MKNRIVQVAESNRIDPHRLAAVARYHSGLDLRLPPLSSRIGRNVRDSKKNLKAKKLRGRLNLCYTKLNIKPMKTQ